MMSDSPMKVSDSNTSKIWRSDTSIKIPPADILSFAFANLGQYDEETPVSASRCRPWQFGRNRVEQLIPSDVADLGRRSRPIIEDFCA